MQFYFIDALLFGRLRSLQCSEVEESFDVEGTTSELLAVEARTLVGDAKTGREFCFLFNAYEFWL